MKCYVFVYGTLRSSKVRKQILGYDPVCIPSSLKGFRKESVQLDGIEYPILTGNQSSDQGIEGDVIELSETELPLLDDYETNAYRRRKVRLENNLIAWVYYK
jgi:gamma-glutamylcyclotransferase (GGCT)/AIG2-like uncharacterized protein YtfP